MAYYDNHARKYQSLQNSPVNYSPVDHFRNGWMDQLAELEDEDDTSKVSIGYNEQIFSPHHDDDRPTLLVDNTENDYYKNKMFA